MSPQKPAGNLSAGVGNQKRKKAADFTGRLRVFEFHFLSRIWDEPRAEMKIDSKK